MAVIHLRCYSCGARELKELSAAEEQSLYSHGFILRPCKTCVGNTRWELYETHTAGRLADAESTPEPLGRILVIDDDESILFIITKALSQQPVELETASSARDAVTLLARADFDLILSDIRMPEFDGKQLFSFLDLHLPEYKDRVIFLTGDTGNPDTMRFLEEMNCPYLPKPLDIPKLIDLVRNRLSKT